MFVTNTKVSTMSKLHGVMLCVSLYVFASIVFGATITAWFFIFHVVVVPLVFKYSKIFRRMMIFGNFVQWPPNINFEEPSVNGIDGARNFYIEFYSKIDRCKVKLGIWHILPKSLYENHKEIFDKNDKEEINSLMEKELRRTESPVIFYCHGNSNSRAAPHRIKLYKSLQQMEYHTIAFDYRGFGDSTNLHPSEHGVVEDTLIVYEWLISNFEMNRKLPPIFAWGHSLGSGIVSHLLGNLSDLAEGLLDSRSTLPLPNALVLEAPFNNLADEVAEHPLAKLVTWLPYHDRMFLAPFRVHTEYTFRSDEYLSQMKSLPVLILHGKHDVVVPFMLGQRLYKAIVESRRHEGGAMVKLHAFAKEENLGHKYICNAQNFDQHIGDFVKNHL